MTPTSWRLIALATLLALLVWTPLHADTAATSNREHTHTHTHSHGHSKERLADGSYAPRDAHHHLQHNAAGDSGEDYDDSGEQHNNEFDHEAILGSVKTAEEFDQLSPKESKRRLALLVREMDLNHDGFIDRHELKAWILRSFRKLAEEEAADRFEDIDTNDDGVITWSEYLLDVYNMENDTAELIVDPLLAREATNQAQLITDDREMFAAADESGDGKLSGAEFVAFNSPEEFAHMLPVILQQTLREKDKNGDGRLDFQEFVGESAAGKDKEWLVAEKDKFDGEFDQDGDGALNGNEILSWVVPSNDEVATEEMDHLFVSADDNHDDRLSYQEIIDHSDTFVGSEATDFGEHLHSLGHIGDEL